MTPFRIRSILCAACIAGIVGVVFMPRVSSEPPKKEGFASARPASPGVPFDGDRAMGYLRDICKLGPRVSGSEAMKKQREMIETHFTKLGAKVARQEFQAKQNSRPDPVTMTNIVATFHPERTKRVLICCHYDTRPIADQEPDRRKWTEPFVSANDGASGVAWMMELAHHLKDFKAEVGIDFAIFDGEEYIFDARPRFDRYFFGSEHFANDYAKSPPKHRYVAGVLLDLFAAPNAKFPWEQNSALSAAQIMQEIWSVAAELKVPAFENRYGSMVDDDHIALNRVGIPTVDLIDFEYPHWHKLSDTPDKCSGATMATVAKVLITWIQRIK